MTQDPQQTFHDEANEHLTELESALLALEQRDDPDLVGQIFRALHTLKGSAAMCGFAAVADFTHRIESVFDQVRSGALAVTSRLVSLSLKALDQLRTMLDSDPPPAVLPAGATGLLAEFTGLDTPAAVFTPPAPRGGAPFEDFQGLLTDYELSRLKANLRRGRHLFSLRTDIPLAEIEHQLPALGSRIKSLGELLTSVPEPQQPDPATIRFRLLFASASLPAELATALGVRPEPVAPPTPEQLAAPAPPEITYRLRFRPAAASLRASRNPLDCFARLHRLGPCRIVAHTDAIPPLGELAATDCRIYWDLILTTAAGEAAICAVFAEDFGEAELHLTAIADGALVDSGTDAKRLGEILVERGDLSPEDLERVLAQQRRLGELLVEGGVVEASKVEAALLEQETVKAARQSRQQRETSGSIRVATERLDHLVDLVGELVTAQARLSQEAGELDRSSLSAIAEEVEHLAGELRSVTLNLRMLPIGSSFGKFQRLVRDLALELDKEVVLVTEGADTELDKTVMEKLSDPLVHLLRNSVDHGIEPPEVRAAAGKPRQGTLRLSAAHSGDSVVISLSDDGAGLDREAIRTRALSQGLLAAGDQPSDQELFALIFAPGFSTARSVTGISGRGVGMDVVKRTLDGLRGSLSIASQPGEGTTLTIQLPLTLAIVEGLLVRIGDGSFILPLNLVDECVELTRQQAAEARGNRLTLVRDELVPYLPLRQRFGIAGEPPAIEQIVVARLGDQRVGFLVDQVIGEHQTVIKSLGRAYRNVPGISGATILGDGNLALILDLPQLVQQEGVGGAV